MNTQQRQQAQQILHNITGLEVRPYSTYDFGREQDPQCLSVVQGRGNDYLSKVRAALPAGLVAFRSTEETELIVGAGETQFDIIRLARTAAHNYNISTEQIVAKLQQYDADTPISINSAETDRIEYTLLEWPKNPEAMAQDIYEFCPDCVDQVLGSIDMLQMQIEMFRVVQLWWD